MGEEPLAFHPPSLACIPLGPVYSEEAAWLLRIAILPQAANDNAAKWRVVTRLAESTKMADKPDFRITLDVRIDAWRQL